MASLLKSNNMARNKMVQKKENKRNTMQVLSQLAMQSNITIKKNLVLRTYSKNPETQMSGQQKLMKLQDLKVARLTANQIINKLTNKVTNVTEKPKGIPILDNRPTTIQDNGNTSKTLENQKVNKMSPNKKVIKLTEVQKPKKVQKNVSLAKKSLLIENKEFYPEKHKRNVKIQKVVLKPKQEYKVVATSNKRKRGIPRKEVSITSTSPIQPSTETPLAPVSLCPEKEDLSISQLIMMAEEQGLDDEDLMEILTCPSPVWWEEHTDDEDEINISFEEDLVDDASKNHQNTSINEIYSKSTTDANANRIKEIKTKLLLKTDFDIFKEYCAKRSNMDKVLNNIRCKKVTSDSDVNEERNICEENVSVVKSVHKDINNKNDEVAKKTKLPLKTDVDIFMECCAKRSNTEKVLNSIGCKQVTSDSDVHEERNICKENVAVVKSLHEDINNKNDEVDDDSVKDCANSCLNNEIMNTLDCAEEKSCNNNELNTSTNEIKNASLGSISDSIDDDLINTSGSIMEESSFENEINFSNKKERKDSGSGGYSDVSLNDELINSLESIQIPVKHNVNEFKDTNEITNENNSNIRYDIVNKNRYESIKRVRKPNKKYECGVMEEKRRRVRKNKEEIKLTKINLGVVPPELPPLTKKPMRNLKTYDSPKSIGSINSETNASVVELDSISDSNVKFLDEYVDNKKEPEEAVNIKKYGQTQTGELVTVYQIVSNKDSVMDGDIESQIKVNLVNKSPQMITDSSSINNNDQINEFCQTKGGSFRSRSRYTKKK